MVGGTLTVLIAGFPLRWFGPTRRPEIAALVPASVLGVIVVASHATPSPAMMAVDYFLSAIIARQFWVWRDRRSGGAKPPPERPDLMP